MSIEIDRTGLTEITDPDEILIIKNHITEDKDAFNKGAYERWLQHDEKIKIKTDSELQNEENNDRFPISADDYGCFESTVEVDLPILNKQEKIEVITNLLPNLTVEQKELVQMNVLFLGFNAYGRKECIKILTSMSDMLKKQ